MEAERSAFRSLSSDSLTVRQSAVTQHLRTQHSRDGRSDTAAQALSPAANHGHPTNKPESQTSSLSTQHLNAATAKPETPAADPALRTDNLHTDALPAPAADSLYFATDSLGMVCDSTFFAADTLPATPPSPYRDVTPGEFFGEASALVQLREPLRQAPQALTGDPFFQLFLLLLAALYARFVYLNLSDVCLLFARTSKDSLSGKQRVFNDQSNVGYSHFLNSAWALGLLFAGASVLKFGAEWLPDAMPHGGALALGLAASVACLLLALVQFGALSLTGAVTLTQPFVGQLIHLRRTYFAVAFLAISPVCLLYILCGEGRGNGCLYFIIAEAIIITSLFLKESLTLFISKKIPILHWFLYLCIVECLPVSFIALMAARQ